MSLEDALKANTEAVTAHTKALLAFSGKAGAATTTAASTTTKPTTTKPKEASDEDMRTAVGDYMAAAVDDDDKGVRRGNVVALLAHYEAKGAAAIPKPKRAAALAHIAELVAGEVPDFMQGGEAGGDDLLG